MNQSSFERNNLKLNLPTASVLTGRTRKKKEIEGEVNLKMK